MRRKGAAAAVVLGIPSVLIGLTALMGASPAFADCPANTFCLYQTHGYAGNEYRYAPSTACTNLTGAANNDANAMRNYRGNYVRLWDLPGCGGSSTYTANPYSYDSDFGNNGFSNKASSLKQV